MIKKRPGILDGGLSNVLEELGCDLNHKLWTARIIEENPEAIIQAHYKYLEAGAEYLTTSSYQATLPGLLELGYTYDRAKALLLKSVELAEVAITEALKAGVIQKRPKIAASVGPYGAYLANGSEYRGNYGLSDAVLEEFHFEKIQLLDRSGADVLAIETIPSFLEAQILSAILRGMNSPSWVSFSCRDDEHLNDGSTLAAAISLFKDHPKVFALGVNCTHPKYISGIIKLIKEQVEEKEIIVYPNSGEAYNAISKTWNELSEPLFFEGMAREWSTLGADIIGGCCRIGPNHIGRIRELFMSAD